MPDSPTAVPVLLDESLQGVLGRALDAADDGAALRALVDTPPVDERDGLLALLALHDVWLAPLNHLRGRERYHGDPAATAVKGRLEHDLLGRIRSRTAAVRAELPDGPAGMRRVAALDRVPAVYRWLEQDAAFDELVAFLAVEGGPDAGFDDLVALVQVGTRDDPKVALAENYWDEMGRGTPGAVHTRLHDEMVAAIGMPRLPRNGLSVETLERMALGGALATNRVLQPEALGALGLLEMQAGPRCRSVVTALQRLGGPPAALAFYEEHAVADPRHGRDWLDRVVKPLAADGTWARRVVDGALWRHEVNDRFFTHLGVGATKVPFQPAA